MKNKNIYHHSKQTDFDSNLTKQHFSNKIFKVYLKYIQQHYPKISVAEICERAGLSDEYIMDETKWTSVIFDQKFTAACIEATGDSLLPYKSGLISLTPESIGNLLYRLTKYTLSTTQIFKTISSQSLNFSKVMSMEIVAQKKKFIHIKYHPINLETLNNDEQKALLGNLDNIYQNTIGYMASVPTIHNQEKAKVKHYREQGENGVDELHMQVTYLETKPVRRIMGWFSSMAVLIAGSGYIWSSQPKEIVSSELTIKILMTGSLSIILLFVLLLINYLRQKKLTGESEKVIKKMDLQYQELQKTKEALRENENFLRKVTENYPNSYVSVIEKDFTVGFSSGLELKKQNINPDKFVGLPWTEVFPDHSDSIQQYLKNTFKGEECSFELSINNQHLSYNTVPLYSEDGSIPRILVVMKNITERKQSETTLRESEEKYRLIAENMADVVVTINMDLRFTYISPSIKQLRGFTVEEALAQTLDQTMTPGSLELLSRVFEEELRLEDTGTAAPDRTRILELEEYKKDGSVIWVKTTSSFMRDKYRKPVGILVVSRDITAQKFAEERIKKLNRLKEDLLIFRTLDDKMKVVSEAMVDILNADFARIWLINPGDFCDSDCMHAEVTEGPHVCHDRDRCLHLIASSGRYTHIDGVHKRVPFGCYKIGRIAAAEEPGFLTNDVSLDPRVHNHEWAKEIGLVSFAGYRLFSDDDTPIGVIALFGKQKLPPEDEATLQTIAGIASDVILLNKSINALEMSEDRLRAVFETAKDMSFIITDAQDLEPIVLEFSPGAEKIFGYKRSEMIGNPVSLLHLPNNMNKMPETFRQMREGKTGFSDETTLVKKSGEKFPAFFSTYPLLDKKGEMYARLGISIDRSKQKKLESQLLQAQKMESVGNLAGGIAHDFNNILTSIIGFTELSLDEVEKGTFIEDNLQEVFTAGKRAKDLVKQILAFARQSEEEVKPIQVDTIVKEVLKFIRATIPSTIEIKQNIESDSLIIANATQVHQILMNLCTNAAYSMEDAGGILEISLKDVVIDRGENRKKPDLNSGNYIEINVADTGGGITPEIIGSIFDPYFTTKGPGEGTGMGLAMVHGIVESYGGKITVDSTPGQGTLFTIYLPVARKRQKHHPYKSETLPTGKERILFVDDEAPIAKMGSKVLEKLGYTVSIRTSSIEALELIRAKPNDFDLVITDMTMPNLTGDKMSIEMMKIRPDIPVILCTGYSKKISKEAASEIGIKGFAYKPVVKSDLAKTVRKVLDDAIRTRA